ncbi:aminotransferase class I/II-fold pyridoxal phosphate-dependent enzyme [Pararhizobium arenae]|uniref:aminotransferase class I/II-fold pyridoxal phosphate-dependent enzyme n=1 Tax=Pararhizobium arenae TaxID=1856850 RepID=UPI00094B64E7|nr:aminotransferase class I/II-fold pyridoxal phosphate-dependent enzyme [Pararhizobium arenae]
MTEFKTRENNQQSLRNTSVMIDIASASFDHAHYQGIMAIYATPSANRLVRLQPSDQPVTDFVRCSYLGLDNHPEILDGAREAISRTGAFHWSCARTRLNFDVLGQLERELSNLFQARILTFTTVLAANMSALPILASGHLTGGRKPLMVFDRLAHATLAHHKAVAAQETEVTTIPHNDMPALEALCQSHRQVAYICDGVYSMGGHAPIGELLRLRDKYGLFLYIDDAHGISIHGETGSGYARTAIHDLGDRTIVAASLGKGFGASGGILMLGTAAQELIFRRFAIAHAFSASLTTAAVGAALASAAIHASPELGRRQQLLQKNLAHLDARLKGGEPPSNLPIRTVRFGDELLSVAAARELLRRGFYTSAIFFPTVARSQAGLRVCLTASHSRQDIDGLCDAIDDVKAEIASNRINIISDKGLD